MSASASRAVISRVLKHTLGTPALLFVDQDHNAAEDVKFVG